MSRLSQLRFAFGIGPKLYCVVALAFLAVAVLAIATIQMSHRTNVAARHLYQDGLLGSRDAVQLQFLFQQHRRAVESAPAELRRERLAATSRELVRLRALIEQALAVDWSDTPEGIEEHTTFSRQIEAQLPAMFQYGDRVLVLAANFSQDQALDIAQGPYAAAADRIQSEVQNWRDKRLRISGDEVNTLLRNARLTLYWVSGGVGFAFVFGLVGLMITRGVIRRVDRITRIMVRLAGQDTSVDVPSRDDRDEIGAMARAVEVFRGNLIARREGEVVLRRTNLQFDAALNSMLQGLVVWGPDHRVQLVNRRFYAITSMPQGCIAAGLTASEVAHIAVSQGLYPGEKPGDVADGIMARLTGRRSAQVATEMRPGLFVQIATEPMSNGGTVITFEDVTEKRQSQAQIMFMARHDALTGLPNRRVFQEHMAAILDDGAEGQPFSLLCLDLDHFKEVNDTLGHPVGDELLRLVAARLRHCVRDHDLVARLGGDEFAVVSASPAGGPELAASLATRLVESIGAPYEIQGHNIVIGVSIGIALSEPGASAVDLLKRADVALYRAKDDRGTFAFFEPAMDELLQARRGMEADLRLALHRDEFELNYQPLYHLAEQRVTGFEALIRWNSPTRGRVSPVDFIPLAEQTGLIIAIGEWVLRTACAEAAAWPDHVRVAVNLSPIQAKNRNVVALVRETLAQTGLPARRLELEITETVMLQDTKAVLTMLHSLREMGVKIVMDDFGTGYSSLSYLRLFPFDKIKIDRSFISDLRGSQSGWDDGMPDALAAAARSAATIVRAIVGLGENLGISTTAEGVETAQQFAQIRQNGCTEVQGYFISPPRPAREVVELLRRLDRTLPAIASSPGVSPQLVA